MLRVMGSQRVGHDRATDLIRYISLGWHKDEHNPGYTILCLCTYIYIIYITYVHFILYNINVYCIHKYIYIFP